MSELNVLFVLVAIALGAVLAISVKRIVRTRSRGRRRVVEQPNSHYTPPAVRAAETKHRWQSIVLDRIHEINREEVVRLLAKVEAIGVDGLRDNERSFLDYVAEIAATPAPAESGAKKRMIAPDLQHRPA